jgi:hypothetical protein
LYDVTAAPDPGKAEVKSGASWEVAAAAPTIPRSTTNETA